MVYSLVRCMTPFKISASVHGHKENGFNRKETLLSRRKALENQLEQKISVALKKCNPNHSIHHSLNNECAVIWDQIEELSNSVHRVKNEIDCFEDDDDCWDSIECKMYDI